MGEEQNRVFYQAVNWLLANAPKWHFLGSILGSQALRPLYFWLFAVPVLAKLLLGFPSPIEFIWQPLDEPVSIALELPFNWKILYFSGLSLAVARTLFVLFCPEFVRENRNAEAAIATGLTVQRVRNIAAEFFYRSYRRKLPHWDSVEGQELRSLLSQYRLDIRQESKDWLAGKSLDSKTGNSLYRKLSDVKFKVNDQGMYLFERARTRDEPWGVEVYEYISKDQFLRHLIWDLLSLQNHYLPWVRVLVSFLTFLAILLAAFPFLQSVLFVLKNL